MCEEANQRRYQPVSRQLDHSLGVAENLLWGHEVIQLGKSVGELAQ